jgi:hypothetical protein
MPSSIKSNTKKYQTQFNNILNQFKHVVDVN